MRTTRRMFFIVLPLTIAVITIASAHAAKSVLLPLGNGKYTTTTAQRGLVYLCNARAEQHAGAFQAGPWIKGKQWDPAQKITVDGAVTWPTASFSINIVGDTRIVSTNTLPSHPSGTYPIASTDDAYRYDRNPNSIRSQSTLSLTLPKNPTTAPQPSCLGGEVGIALTGVPIFNGFDAGLRDAVAYEIQDAYSGHPQMHGEYHYHNISDAVVELLSKNTRRSSSVLVGYAFDGFGIFGPTEHGKILTNADLDECHGHTSKIRWDGKTVSMYHYHATSEFPYTVGCFKGTPILTGPTTGGNNPQRTHQPAGDLPGSGPPQEAFDACLRRRSGESCTFADANGSHTGTCGSPPLSSQMVCMPR